MTRSQAKTGLPRKVVAYYLFFCLIAACCFVAALLAATHDVANSRSVGASLTRLGRAAAAIEIDYLRNGTDDFQTHVEKLREQGDSAYCSISDNDGQILADTRPDRVGQQSIEFEGKQFQWGGVLAVELAGSAAESITEYRAPLNASGEALGILRMAVRQPSLAASAWEVANAVPIYVIMPLALVAAGGVALARIANPIADVEKRLRWVAQQPLQSQPELQNSPLTSVASLGWNRIVEYVAELREAEQTAPLDARLKQAADASGANQHELILGHLADGVAMTDADGRLQFANRAIAALLDDDLDDPNAGSFVERLLSRSESVSDPGALTQQTGLRTTVVEMTRNGGGKDRVIRVARQPMADAAAPGHVWSLRDVTQQKLAEQTRDRFIDAATHELRTPLANIKAYAETLATADALEVEQQKEFCNVINSEVTRLARFVDDLLSISSMEVGSLTVETHNVELGRLFDEVLDKVRPLLTQKGLTLDVQLPDKLGELQLDKDKIVAVMVNLLGNAAKYTPRNGRVSLKVTRDDEQLRMVVDDTGVGIAADELPRVFEKFFRSEDPRVQAETGSGLGLSLAREVIRMHGGEITVESKIDQGSSFTVMLPVAAGGLNG